MCGCQGDLKCFQLASEAERGVAHPQPSPLRGGQATVCIIQRNVWMGSVEASGDAALQYKVVGICASWDLFLGGYKDEKRPQVICFVQSSPHTRLLYCFIQTDVLLPSCELCFCCSWEEGRQGLAFCSPCKTRVRNRFTLLLPNPIPKT